MMLPRSLQGSARTLLAAAATFLFATVDLHAEGAAKVNVFTKFVGNWIGNGKIFLSSGKQENIRCRGTFSPNEVVAGVGMKLELRCANETFNFELQSEINYNGTQVSGNWTERSRGLNGTISGSMKGDEINAVVESQTFTAMMDLINNGDKQQVRITSPGSEMSDVLIGLIRK